MYDVREYLYKILVIGDVGTGKTSIIKRYVHNIFSMNYKSTTYTYLGVLLKEVLPRDHGANQCIGHRTFGLRLSGGVKVVNRIGVDFALKVIQWSPDTVVRLQLWDIAGQERGNMTRVYYKEAVAALVVYDVTRPKTFEAVKRWKADLDAKVSLPYGGGPIHTILLANKTDLQTNASAGLDAEEMDAFCEEHGFLKWFATSAKDNKNIEDATRFLLEKIMAAEEEHAHNQTDQAAMLDRVQLSQSKVKEGCC